MSTKTGLYLAALAAAALLPGAPAARASNIIALNWADTTGNNNNTGYAYVAHYVDPSNVNLSTSDVLGAPGVATAGWQNSYDPTSENAAANGYLKSGTIPAMTLTDTAGNLTTATLTVDPTGTGLNGMDVLGNSIAWNQSATANDPTLPTALDRLYNAHLGADGGRTTELALQNIPFAQYDIYAYMVYSQYQSGSVQLFAGGTLAGAQNPIYYSTGLGWVPVNQYGGYPDSSYTQITSTDSANPTITNNSAAYIRFSGLSGATQYLDLVGNGGIAGLEIVAVPEPASLALLGLGGLLLATGRKRSGRPA